MLSHMLPEKPCLHAFKMLLPPPQTSSVIIALAHTVIQIESIGKMLQAEYILDLQKQLTLMGSEARRESNGTLSSEESIPSMTTVDKLRSQLDDAIASECPFCGDLMIREISLPFIHPGEGLHVLSWEINPNVGSQRNISDFVKKLLAVEFGCESFNPYSS
ncbi:hypothetical protein CR513_42290, partial [Mucuna pruriens]